MQPLRDARLLARLVLVWFALAIGVAIASPMVDPQGIDLVCSGSGGMKLLVKDGEGGKAASKHTLDCPLCAHLAAPPPAIRTLDAAQPLTHALKPLPAAHIAALTAAPLPARGPPALS